MTEDKLKAIILPRANVSLPENDFNKTVEFQFQQDGENTWYLWGMLEGESETRCSRELLPQEEIIDILEDVQDIDQYCQTEDFCEKLKTLARRVVEEIIEPKLEHRKPPLIVELEPYLLQQHAVSTQGEALFLKLAPNGDENISIPKEFAVSAPVNFIPNEVAQESLLQRIYEGVPAISLVGPTGSGKSALARYVGA